MMRALWIVWVGVAVGVQSVAAAEEGQGQALSLWYGQPAVRWMASLPVGNGRLGAMVFGGVGCERIALNE